jgi:cell division protein FtsW
MFGFLKNREKGRPDIVLFFTVFALAGTGLAMVYSASAVLSLKVYGDSFYILKRQLMWFIGGFALLMFFQELDYKVYLKATRYILPAAFILLICVFVPGLGHSAKGSSRWIGQAAIKIQPSEFVKVVMVIYLAKVFSAEHRSDKNQTVQVLLPLAVLAAMFVMILLQPDFGTAIDLVIVSVCILFVSGFSLLYLLGLFVLSVPAFYLFIYQVGYRWDRIKAYTDPWHDKFGIGYHIVQSFVAFRLGGLLGVGLGFGSMKIARLPEPHTDFIYAVIAEEAGFFGTAAVIILFCILFWRGARIALDAPDSFSKLLATGVTLMVVIQAFINIGVVTGSLPTTGVPLPFISYGGSSLWSNMICAGILLSISRFCETGKGKVGDFGTQEVW